MDKRIDYWVAIVLAIVFGCIGLQHFYTRQTVWGVLGVLFCWTGIPSIVGYIQAAIWLFDGKDEFNKKFNS